MSKAVKYTPRTVPPKGKMSLNKWIWISESIMSPNQKAPPILRGIIMNSTIGNFIKNSHQLVLIFNNCFNMMPAPR